MQNKNPITERRTTFLLLLAVGISLLFFWVIKGFVLALVLAAVLAAVALLDHAFGVVAGVEALRPPARVEAAAGIFLCSAARGLRAAALLAQHGLARELDTAPPRNRLCEADPFAVVLENRRPCQPPRGVQPVRPRRDRIRPRLWSSRRLDPSDSG